MPNWIEETKNEIIWDEGEAFGWFSNWFAKGWFSGNAVRTEETKEITVWTQS